MRRKKYTVGDIYEQDEPVADKVDELEINEFELEDIFDMEEEPTPIKTKVVENSSDQTFYFHR